RFCRLLFQTLQRALLLDRPLALSLRHRLLPLGGAHRRTPPRPRIRARRGLASSTRATFVACRSPLVSAISQLTSRWAQRPCGRLPSAKPSPRTESRSPSSVRMNPRSLTSLNQSILPRIGGLFAVGRRAPVSRPAPGLSYAFS